MARVGVEQKALTDPRFDLLGRAFGTTRFDALGRMLLVWNECQERGSYHLPTAVVSALLAHDSGAELLVKCGLAEHKRSKKSDAEPHLRIKGTEGRIEWLAVKRERAKENGAKGGRPRRLQAETQPEPKKNQRRFPQETPLTPALTPAPATAQKTEEKESASQSNGEAPSPAAMKPDEPAVKATPKSPRKTPDSPHHRSIAVFTDGWRNRYGETYPFNAGKDAEAFKAMLAHVGGDEAKLAAVIGRYLADDDEFAAKARHSIGVLRSQFAKWLVDAPPVTSRPPPRGGFETPQDRIRANLIDVCEDEP